MLTESEVLDIEHRNLFFNKPYGEPMVYSFATQSGWGPCISGIEWTREPLRNAESQTPARHAESEYAF